MEKHLLFVYGTLKSGFWNHHYLEDSEYLGKAETKEKYAMYVGGIPFVVKGQKVSTIKGEVYEVSKDVLKEIDRLEGHPFAYRREKVKVKLEDGKEVEAWMYFWRNNVEASTLNPEGEYISESFRRERQQQAVM
jgi:gamma-glutamylcyclotransferase (GGCT)/AIG2-like uncharacterized protein YtfP